MSGSNGLVTISPEGITTLTYFATDTSGRQESSQTLTVKIDKTPPQTNVAASPPANAAGWNNANVNLTFAASDPAAAGITPSGINTISVTDNGTNLTCTPGGGKRHHASELQRRA